MLVNDYGGGTDGKGGSGGPANAVVDEIRKAGGNAVGNADSVATVECGADIVGQALDEWGRIDIVINNAGITLGRSFADNTDEEIDYMHAVHLRGTINVLRPAWRAMVKQGYGRILNTASNSVFGSPDVTAYATPKAGIIGLTKGLAQEGAPYNIKANVLMPAAFTRMSAQIEHEEFRSWLERHFPPALVAPIAAFLVHEDVPCSGEIISSGGGRSAKVFMGEAVGFQAKDHTLEEIKSNFDRVMDPTNYRLMKNLMDDIAMFMEIFEWKDEKNPSLFKD